MRSPGPQSQRSRPPRPPPGRSGGAESGNVAPPLPAPARCGAGAQRPKRSAALRPRAGYPGRPIAVFRFAHLWAAGQGGRPVRPKEAGGLTVNAEETGTSLLPRGPGVAEPGKGWGGGEPLARTWARFGMIWGRG